MHRVQKLLSNYGYCSRRKAEELIKSGRVKVNLKVITIGDQALETDKIFVDNKLISKSKVIYLKFHKPVGYVTALTDNKYPTIMDIIKVKERVFPVGRLDFNTSGLLLLTNDGDFANKIMHPRNSVKKTYSVRIDRPIKKQDVIKIEKGIRLKDGMTSPSKVKRITNRHLLLTIHEGKNRIIKRMLKKLGFNVTALKRIQIGKIVLGKLKPGEYKEFRREELYG